MKQIIKTAAAPSPVGPYNQAVMINGTLYVSGQIAIIPATGELLLTDIEAETTQVMENLKAILSEAGLNFGNVVKSTIFLSDMEMFGRVNKIYGAYFSEDTAPARETVQVANLPKYVNVEISCIAVKF
jgi:2-iminobutanoate/2-iminopropanoate deaminase